MGQSELQNFWNDYDEKSDLLQQALDKLVQQEGDADGLKGEFSEQAAMKLMEEAMESLANEYVQHLESFKMASEPVEVLGHLEVAETLWRSQARVIQKFDPNGEESKFLAQMRQLALNLMVDKLEEASERAGRNAKPENVACVLGLMAVIDHVWGEQGRPLNDPERQEFRKIAKSFR